MARRPRLTFEGAIHHVCFRGNAQADIFADDAERRHLLDLLAERVPVHGVRLYLYCLMRNHVHLLVETPRGNLSAFMGSLLTAYTVYVNRRHKRAGHLTQGRFKSPLVAGDQYLLRLSRYIHLNPVAVEPWSKRPLAARVAHLRAYPWSSYRAYAGLADAEPFVDYGPLGALTAGPKRGRTAAYRQYAEDGLIEVDDELALARQRSALGIGNAVFVADLDAREREAAQQLKREDVAFRCCRRAVAPDQILAAVARHFGVAEADLSRHRVNDMIKPVAAALLTRHGGLTQRAAAAALGLTTGAAVCLALKRLPALAPAQAALRQIERELNI